jgi:hypothetical protein
MRKPDDFMAMFERKTHGQNKTMDELANDFSNLLPDGPFQRSWLQYAFIAGFRAGYDRGAEAAHLIYDAVREHLEKEIFPVVQHEPLLKDYK